MTRVLGSGSTPEVADGLAPIFKALGDPTRLRIVLGLVDQHATAGELATTLGLSPSLVSKHLSVLRSARLVVGTRRARRVSYSICDRHVRTMLDEMLSHTSEVHRGVGPLGKFKRSQGLEDRKNDVRAS